MQTRIDKRRKSVLIVECDTAILALKSLDIGAVIYRTIRSFYPTNRIEIVRTTTEHELLRTFSKYAEENVQFTNIVLIGHSSKVCFHLCSNRTIHWTGAATWFEKLRPKKIFLIGCSAGRWLPCKALFGGIASLDEIYGSPTNLNKIQASSIIAMVLYSLGVKKNDLESLRGIQVASLAFLKSLMFRWTRRQYQTTSIEEGEYWSIGEDILHQLFKRRG